MRGFDEHQVIGKLHQDAVMALAGQVGHGARNGFNRNHRRREQSGRGGGFHVIRRRQIPLRRRSQWTWQPECRPLCICPSSW